ncbi:MAG TPA: hypothetical protein PLT04_00975 [Candidatus Saccharibacteria bacterium]|nr:hypothetical protein [Candidatus Saccharibacteria bacterium]
MTLPVGLVRAITAVFIRKLVRRVGIVAYGILLLLLVALILLSFKVSAWWLLVLIVFFPVAIAITAALVALWYISGRLAPRRLSAEETYGVNAFTERLLAVVERARTPLPILLLGIGKDLLIHRESRVVGDTIAASKELRDEYRKLEATFHT